MEVLIFDIDHIVLTLVVNGINYKSDRLSILTYDHETDSAVSDDIKTVVKRDIKSKTVDIFVNPKEPHAAVLVRGISKWKILFIYFIGLLSLLQIIYVGYFLI